MPKVTTNSFRVNAAQKLAADIASSNSAFYVAIGTPQGWGASSPTVPEDSVSGASFDVFDTMVAGKKVGASDVTVMVPRHDWAANTVYTAYDDKDGSLFTKPFFAHVYSGGAHYVFKCLANAGNTASAISPDFSQTSANDAFYSTSDDYRWKYMYQCDDATWAKFATSDWMPVVVDPAVTGNAAAGAMDTIKVENGGSRYNSYTSGTFSAITADVTGALTVCQLDAVASANANFYTGCAIKITAGAGAGQQRNIASYSTAGGNRTAEIDAPWDNTNPPNTSSTYEVSPLVIVVGDGTGATARAIINAASNTVSSVEMTNRGYGYTFAAASVSGNTGVSMTNNAQLRAIISPKYGHGGSVAEELGASAVGIGLQIGAESNLIATNGSFATASLIVDPIWANVIVQLTSITGLFTVGEVVTVNGTRFNGDVLDFNPGTSTLTIVNVTGGFVPGATIVGSSSGATATVSSTTIGGISKTFATFDQRFRQNVTYNGGGPFVEGETITSGTANGVVQFANTTFVGTTSNRGGWGNVVMSSSTSANVVSTTQSDIIRTSGQVLLVENVQPVTRGTNSFKFVIGH